MIIYLQIQKAIKKKARETIIEKYGADHWRKIGKIGGASGFTGGFYNNHELAVRAGTKGGTISRRGKATTSKIDSITTIQVLRENVPLVEIQDLGYAVDDSPTIDLDEHSSWFERLKAKLR